jgi:hypothetical protein
MYVELQRSFSLVRDATNDPDDLYRNFQSRDATMSWIDLRDKHVVVILGEAGVGKTSEFENEAKRLQQQGLSAFYVPLNTLDCDEAWRMAVSDCMSHYDAWKNSEAPGYFFLDAVDETRLVNHAFFRKALGIVNKNLGACVDRLHVFLSSRIPDWSIEDVRSTVHRNLVAPIDAALNPMKLQEAKIEDSRPNILLTTQSIRKDPLTLLVVYMNCLSRRQAEILAEAFQVDEPPKFWAAVDDGCYEYMATRPQDLQWMVAYWNNHDELGTYLELLDRYVTNQLTEFNPHYQSANVVLSTDRLRFGAERLAAAMEFSGKPFVSIQNSDIDEFWVSPATVLPDWRFYEILLLLASSIFDESTFNRVKFHHRSTREFLAASWVNRQIEHGLPFNRTLQLFCAAPFGDSVLISSRRAALCWFAALNVKAREWISQDFPEILFFEGDPEAWNTLLVEHAIKGYVKRFRSGFHPNWENDPSEFRRLGRRLSPSLISSLLLDKTTSGEARLTLLQMIKYGLLADCAESVM